MNTKLIGALAVDAKLIVAAADAEQETPSGVKTRRDKSPQFSRCPTFHLAWIEPGEGFTIKRRPITWSIKIHGSYLERIQPDVSGSPLPWVINLSAHSKLMGQEEYIISMYETFWTLVTWTFLRVKHFLRGDH